LIIFGPIKLNLILPLFIEVPVSSQESERSCIFVLEVSILSPSMIFLLDLGTVQTVWFFFFNLILLFQESQKNILIVL